MSLPSHVKSIARAQVLSNNLRLVLLELPEMLQRQPEVEGVSEAHLNDLDSIVRDCEALMELSMETFANKEKQTELDFEKTEELAGQLEEAAAGN